MSKTINSILVCMIDYVYNGLRLGVVADYYHKCSYEAHTSNIPRMFLRSTSPAITPNRCCTNPPPVEATGGR